MKNTNQEIKTYFVTIPAQDCNTICGLLGSIKGKLDDMGGDDANNGSGQIMAFINEPAGRIFYFYHDPERFWKFVRPVRKVM